MPPDEQRSPSQARTRRLHRLRLIRRRTAATALATFVLAFGVISGAGSMGATHKASSVQHKQPARSSSSSSASSAAESEDQSPSTAGQGSTELAPAPVTTQQS